MINTSTEFKQAHERNSVCVSKATILLKDGTLLEINNSQISQGATKIDDGVTGSNKFTIGSAITNKLTLSLNNRYDAFSDYDFTDAVVTVWVGKQLPDRIEWLKKGVYNTDDPTATPAILSLECLDNMSKFDTTYDGGIGFPASLQAIVQHCCTQCGVLLLNGEFPNFRYQISKNPFTDTTNITYRAIIAYCALLAGCYARCNTDGRLEFKWYDTAAFDGIIDGGVFDETTETYYQTGADLDGGNFTDYTSGDNADGGTFTDVLPYHHIYSFSSLSVSTEDVVITGIRVTAADSEDDAGKKIEGETYLCGAEGYILDVSGNPLVEAGKAREVAEYLAGRVVGMRFRPFQASAIGDPSWEAGDAAVVTDRKGNSYYTYLTNITYSTGSYASISCDAEPAARHSADRYAEINKVIADIKKDSQQKLSEYGKMLEQMNSLAINAMGYYETSVKQDDGSDITYMHDKPVLSESKIVYKKSIDGTFWTNDYQGTDAATTAAGKWKSGIDKDGNAVLNVIAAIGIYADWIVSGKISSKNGKVYFDLDNNKLVCDEIVTTETNPQVSGIYAKIGTGKIYSSGSSGPSTSVYGLLISKKGEEHYGIGIQPGTSDLKPSIFTGTEGFVFKSRAHYDNSAGDGCVAGIATTGKGYLSLFAGNANLVDTDSGIENTSTSAYLGRILLCPRYSYNSGTYTSYGDIYICGGKVILRGDVEAINSFTCTGIKSRKVETPNYGNRLQYCYEMPSPMFGDIGEGITDENGECIITIDDIFSETIAKSMEYHVFLQKEGIGDLYVAKKTPTYFIVRGTENLKFEWELKARQRDYEYERLETENGYDSEMDIDYESRYIEEINALIQEQEDALYETT